MRITHAQFAALQGNTVSEFAITLPWPPTVNTYWRSLVIKGKLRVLISKEGIQYRAAVLAAWLDAGRPRVEGRLSVSVEAFPPDNRVRDLDNLGKSILDSLTHAVAWADDGQIDEISIVRREVEKPGRVVVRVRCVG